MRALVPACAPCVFGAAVAPVAPVHGPEVTESSAKPGEPGAVASPRPPDKEALGADAACAPIGQSSSPAPEQCRNQYDIAIKEGKVSLTTDSPWLLGFVLVSR